MSVDISHVEGQIPHKDTVVLATHQNNNLLSRGTPSHHLDSWFWLWVAFNDIVNLINLLSIKSWECFLDLENF